MKLIKGRYYYYKLGKLSLVLRIKDFINKNG